MTLETNEAIRTRLTEVFRDVFDDDALVVEPTMTAADVDGWDSLTHVRLMLNVERAFGIRLTASDIGKLKSVGDLMALIERKAT
jgi:acyl carrier protein